MYLTHAVQISTQTAIQIHHTKFLLKPTSPWRRLGSIARLQSILGIRMTDDSCYFYVMILQAGVASPWGQCYTDCNYQCMHLWLSLATVTSLWCHTMMSLNVMWVLLSDVGVFPSPATKRWSSIHPFSQDSLLIVRDNKLVYSLFSWAFPLCVGGQ